MPRIGRAFPGQYRAQAQEVAPVVTGAGPQFRSAFVNGEHTTANSVYTKPTGVVSGDWLVIYQFVYRGVGTPVFTNADATPPTGFVALPGTWLQAYTGGATDKYGQFGWIKQAGGSEPSTYTVTHVALAAARGIMFAVSGANATTPIDTSTQNLSGGGGHTTTFLGLTTAAANELIIAIASDDNDLNGTLVAPTGSTPTFTIGANDHHGNFLAYGTLAAAGATGNKTMSNNSNADFSFFASLLAFQS